MNTRNMKKRVLRHLPLFAACLLLLALPGCLAEKIIRVSDKAEVQFPDLLKEMQGVRLVFAGEVHDEKWTHRMQLRLIKALHEAGIPVAIGMEMFQSADQKDLDAWVNGKLDTESFIDLYYTRWHMPWSLYRDILYYARDNRIPVIGLNISRKIIHQVFTKGFKSLTPEQLKDIPIVTCDIDEEYKKFIEDAMGEHKTEAGFMNFCEAQMVWDATMAVNALDYLDEHPERTMVVLAGSGHSWRRGIPSQVRKRSSETNFVVVLPGTAKRVTRETVTDGDADFLWVRTYRFW